MCIRDRLRPAYGSNTKSWRRGRGHASGNGKTAGRGHKGQGARSGSGGKAGFEGGQMPLYRRLPKRGFKCINSKEIVAINVDTVSYTHLDVYKRQTHDCVYI